MRVLFAMWLLLAGMKAGFWEGGFETEWSGPARTTEVVAAEGPFNPPPKP
jgi:hypothetical protein